jgi:hypothetical protein
VLVQRRTMASAGICHCPAGHPKLNWSLAFKERADQG